VRALEWPFYKRRDMGEKPGCTNGLHMEEGEKEQRTSCFASRMGRREDKTITISKDYL
jgi:hypothetical protein